jgi:hypothetical protein
MFVLLFAVAAHAQNSPNYVAIVAAPDRSAADHKLDANRAPAQWLAFLGIKPGLTVLDIVDVYGYTAELMAGAGAKVYAQNSEAGYARVKDQLEPRLKTPAGANIVSIARPFDDPAPPGMQFDLVTFFFAYHDITYRGVDRPKMLRAVYAALKPHAISSWATGRPSQVPAPASSRHCTGPTRPWCDRRSRQPDLNLSDMAISCAIPKTSATPIRIPRTKSMLTC